MQKLISYLQNVGFDETDSHKIAACFRQKTLEKDDFFVEQGRVSTQMGFLESGQLQYFSLAENGEERTTYVSLPNTFVASLLTYLSETPAREHIRALTHAVLWVIDKKDVLALQNKIPGFKDFYIQLIEYQICCIDQKRFDLITLSAEKRYEKILKDEPGLIQQVPLQYIASMLGVTPRHLSRLRNNL
jgi:CRP-like cAMP-binding protein